MPWKRGEIFYLKRKLPGLGRVNKTLGTRNPARARALEAAIVRLCDRGYPDLVRAFLEGKIDAQQLAEAAEIGRIHELAAEIQRMSAPLREAVDAVLRAKEADVRDSTRERYRFSLEHLRSFAGDETPVHEVLTTDRLRDFKLHRREQKAKPETVNNDLIAVSVLCTYALERGWIDRRPKMKKYPTRIRIRYLEADQLRLYMAALRASFRPVFQLLIGTGIRIGEAEVLRACDLRLALGEARALVEDSKSPAGVRAVFIPEWVAETLRAHLEASGASGTDPVFPIPRELARDEHKRACRIAGIAAYTMHDHRHTAAVHLARAGMPLHLLQQQLGHSTIAMTMRYARFHPNYGDVGRYFERVAEGLGVRHGTGAIADESKDGRPGVQSGVHPGDDQVRE